MSDDFFPKSRFLLSRAPLAPQSAGHAPSSAPSVLVALDSETQAREFDFARRVFPELKPRMLVPNSGERPSFALFLPKNVARNPLEGAFVPESESRGGASAPQAPARREATGWQTGGLVSSILAGAAFLEKADSIELRLTESAKALIENARFAFLAALLQRGVTHKLRRGNSKDAAPAAATKDSDQATAASANAASQATAEPAAPKLILVDQDVFSAEDLRRAQIYHESMLTTRGLVNMPANILGPDRYERTVAEKIDELAREVSGRADVGLRVYDREALEREHCGLILAVGRASAQAPRIIKLSYSPRQTAGQTAPRHVALVGKGITFDSGGLDIKPSSGMRNMKKDMGGSAAALGAFLCAARLGVPLRLSCYLAIAENAISGDAMRPGDIYTARNGAAVEIDNTDAEGRLVLADALSLASEEKPDWLITLATLTGACRVALGPAVDGLFATTPAGAQRLLTASAETGDWVWQLPFVDDYESYFDSSVADFANSGSSGFAGAIIAALFLRRFTAKCDYAHIDTFMWSDRPTDVTAEAGATPKCVRLVTRALESFAGLG